MEKNKMVTNGVRESWSGGVALVKELRDALANELHLSRDLNEMKEESLPSPDVRICSARWKKSKGGLCSFKW